MKILYVITALGVGGAEIVTINIANQIVSRGYGVTILHLREMNNLKLHRSESSNSDVEHDKISSKFH